MFKYQEKGALNTLLKRSHNSIRPILLYNVLTKFKSEYLISAVSQFVWL